MVLAGTFALATLPSIRGFSFACVVVVIITGQRGLAANIQFDINDSLNLTYTGINSPGHVAGDFQSIETTWNGVRATGLSTGIMFSDGSPAPGIVVEAGVSPDAASAVSWGTPPSEARDEAQGVFDTNFGFDRFFATSGKKVGLRVKGLPAGQYRVYAIGRPGTQFSGNDSFNMSVGVNLDDLTGAQPTILPWSGGTPIFDSWVNGETHMVATITTTSVDDYITVINQENNPGGSFIIASLQGLQVAQVPEPETFLLCMVGLACLSCYAGLRGYRLRSSCPR